jgi:hypothetical protein
VQRILFVVNGRPAVEQLGPLARLFRDEGYAESIFWLTRGEDAQHSGTLADLGFRVVGPGASVIPASSPERSASAPASPDRRTRRFLFARPIVHVLRTARRCRTDRRRYRKTISSLGVSAVITSQERPPDFLPVVAAAQDLRIPVVLIPTNFLCSPDGGAYTRREDLHLLAAAPFGRNQTAEDCVIWVMNRFVRRCMPKQVLQSRFGEMLCEPGHHLLGLWVGGLLTSNTWHQGTRFVDRIVVGGDEEKAVCRDAAIPDERISKIGTPIFEVLRSKVANRARIRRELCDTLRLDADKKIVILAVPSMWEHNMVTHDEQFELLEQVLGVLRSYDGPVLLSLHPRSRARDYEALSERYRMPILTAPLMDVLPAADVFVANAYSSTIRWAIALGLPTVNLDFWDLNESTYDDYPEYPVVRTIAEFERWYARALVAPWEGPSQLTIPSENVLGISMDGQFPRRLRTLIDALIGERQAAPEP